MGGFVCFLHWDLGVGYKIELGFGIGLVIFFFFLQHTASEQAGLDRLAIDILVILGSGLSVFLSPLFQRAKSTGVGRPE